jgi:hypothetical protein
MQELPRVIQDCHSIRQGRKETKVRDENGARGYNAEPRRNSSFLASALRQFPIRVTVNRNGFDLSGHWLQSQPRRAEQRDLNR